MPAQPVRLPDLVRRLEDLTVLPAILHQVIELTRDDRSSAADIAGIVALDQALTARMLRLANSAYYGRQKRVATVRDAVVVIGFNEVRGLVFARGLGEAFPGQISGPFRPDLFWGHAVTCGIIAQVMATETGLAPREEAFTAGILHDIGKLVLNQELPQEFNQAVQMTLDRGIQLIDAELRVFGFSHADVGWELARRWNFPLSLAHVLAHHHATNLQAAREPLTYLVAQANNLCYDHGLWPGIEPQSLVPFDDGTEADPFRARILHRLGGMDQVMDRARAYLETAFGREHRWRHNLPPRAMLRRG